MACRPERDADIVGTKSSEKRIIIRYCDETARQRIMDMYARCYVCHEAAANQDALQDTHTFDLVARCDHDPNTRIREHLERERHHSVYARPGRSLQRIDIEEQRELISIRNVVE